MRRNSRWVGGVRASALWGTGGRGPRKIGSIGAVVALVLCLPLAAGARSSSVHTHSTTVPPSLVGAALAHPQQMFDVIIQSAGGADSADVARTVRGTVRSRVVKRQYRALRTVSASVTGAGLLRLAKQHGIYAITPNNRVTSTIKNPQNVAGRDRNRLVLGLAARQVLDRGDDRDRRLRHRQLEQAVRRPPAHAGRLHACRLEHAADGRGHGTFVAGVAASAGRFGGAAPNAKLVSLKVFDDRGNGMTSDVLRATDWILQHKDKYGIRVANFSLQTGLATSFRFDPLDRALEQLWQSGVVVVAAAGNYGVDGAPSGVLFSPANDPFVITVGAVDVGRRLGTGNDVNAPWSAYGYTVDGFAKPELGAPGRYLNEWVPANTSLAAERPTP